MGEYYTLQIVEKVESLSNYDLEVRFGHLWCAKLNNHISKVAVFPLELHKYTKSLSNGCTSFNHSSTKIYFSENGNQDYPTCSSTSQQNNGSNNTDYVPLSPLSLLAEEAARRTPTLNLAPCTTLDVPLDPKFIGGPIIAGSEFLGFYCYFIF